MQEQELDDADETLLLLRDELYGGSWDEVEADLRARAGRKPYVFKLSTRIEEDLNRIARLRALEERGVDLRAAFAERAGDSQDPRNEGETP